MIKMTFGLTKEMIKTIESEHIRYGGEKENAKYSRYLWDKLGKELGWEPLTLALYYLKYSERNPKQEDK